MVGPQQVAELNPFRVDTAVANVVGEFHEDFEFSHFDFEFLSGRGSRCCVDDKVFEVLKFVVGVVVEVEVFKVRDSDSLGEFGDWNGFARRCELA